MGASELSAGLQAFIGHSAPTMDHVAVLLALRAEPAVAHPSAELARRTRLDPALVDRVAHELTAARLVSREGDAYRYAPPPDLVPTVDELADMYHTKPVTLVRAIYDRPGRAVQSFADAFRLRRPD